MGDPVPFLSVVVPAFNEARCIAKTIETLGDYLRARSLDWEIRIVDDGSTDATVAIAEASAAWEPRVVVQREPHRGKGGAVRAGLLAARGQYRFMCDADLSMPVTGIDRFLPPIATGFDVAIGTREGPAARRHGEPWLRHAIGRVFNFAVQRLVLPGIEDSQCGFKMFTAAAVEVVFPLTTVDGWGFDVEVLAIARARGLRIVEMPIEWHYREESRIRMVPDAWKMLTELLRIRARVMASSNESKAKAH